VLYALITLINSIYSFYIGQKGASKIEKKKKKALAIASQTGFKMRARVRGLSLHEQ
jgi:hypothetical protein